MSALGTDEQTQGSVGPLREERKFIIPSTILQGGYDRYKQLQRKWT